MVVLLKSGQVSVTLSWVDWINLGWWRVTMSHVPHLLDTTKHATCKFTWMTHWVDNSKFLFSSKQNLKKCKIKKKKISIIIYYYYKLLSLESLPNTWRAFIFVYASPSHTWYSLSCLQYMGQYIVGYSYRFCIQHNFKLSKKLFLIWWIRVII